MIDIVAALESSFDEIHYLDFYREIFPEGSYKLLRPLSQSVRRRYSALLHDLIYRIIQSGAGYSAD